MRDANGNVLALYEGKANGLHVAPETIVLKETIIYGSSRIGQYRGFKNDAAQGEFNKKTALGQRIYEFSNHLGNVLVTLTDHKLPQAEGGYKSFVLSASDYYPFGLAMTERTYQNGEYRFGFNGRETDEDFSDNTVYKERIYDPAIARWTKVDGRTDLYPAHSPYAFTGNNPNANFEQDGNIFGTIGGAIIGAVVNGAIAAYKGENVWKAAGKGAIAGAAAGAIVDLTIATAGTGTVALLAAGAASGAVGSAVQQGLDIADGTRQEFSTGEVVFSAGLGLGLGYLGSKLAPYAGRIGRAVRGIFKKPGKGTVIVESASTQVPLDDVVEQAIQRAATKSIGNKAQQTAIELAEEGFEQGATAELIMQDGTSFLGISSSIRDFQLTDEMLGIIMNAGRTGSRRSLDPWFGECAEVAAIQQARAAGYSWAEIRAAAANIRAFYVGGKGHNAGDARVLCNGCLNMVEILPNQ